MTLNPIELISELEKAPRWLTATAERLSGAEDGTTEGEWSFAELVSHIVASDVIVSSRVMQVLVRPGVVLPGFDERRWAEIATRSGASIEEQLKLFIGTRMHLIKLLRDLDEEEWKWKGIHEEAGEISILQIVQKLASHEAEHVAQAERMGDKVDVEHRLHLDEDEYLKHVRSACFVCETVTGNPNYQHAIVYEDASAIAFLAKYGNMKGHVLVASKHHREEVTGHYSQDEYCELQSVVWLVGEALRKTLPTERLYVASMGSQQANRHVHWHVVPLPPGVPYEHQQWAAFMRGVLEISFEEKLGLAESTRRAIGEILASQGTSTS